MDNILLGLHSGVRWIVLLAAVVALAINVYALLTKRPAGGALVKNGMRLWTISMDVQWLIGLILILITWVFSGLAGSAPRSVWEHAVAMTLAVVVVHSVAAFRKRPDQMRLLLNIVSIVIALAIVIVAVSLVNGWS